MSYAQIIKNLNSKLDGYEKGARRGLLKGGFIIMRRAQQLAPVDKGDLRRNVAVRFTPENKNKVEMVFLQKYAITVHENLEAAHGTLYNTKHADAIARGSLHSRGPQQTSKFLEKALNEKKEQAFAVIREESRK